MGGDAEKEILDILQKAIKRERNAEAIYRRGAEIALRSEVKETFEKLANEEAKHEEVVKELYHQTKKRLGLKILHEDE